MDRRSVQKVCGGGGGGVFLWLFEFGFGGCVCGFCLVEFLEGVGGCCWWCLLVWFGFFFPFLKKRVCISLLKRGIFI